MIFHLGRYNHHQHSPAVQLGPGVRRYQAGRQDGSAAAVIRFRVSPGEEAAGRLAGSGPVWCFATA